MLYTCIGTVVIYLEDHGKLVIFLEKPTAHIYTVTSTVPTFVLPSPHNQGDENIGFGSAVTLPWKLITLAHIVSALCEHSQHARGRVHTL